MSRAIRVVIAVYYIHADCSRAPTPWLEGLPPHKRRQLLDARDPRDRWRTLAGLQLLKRGCRELGIAGFQLADLQFLPGRKPRCGADLDFSISHSGNLVGCAIHRSGSVGLDIERETPINPAAFRLYLSPEERSWATGGRFFSVWTRKESVVKAHGSSGLPQVRDVQLTEEGARFAGKHWSTRRIDLAPGYSACVATEAGARPAPISVRELRLESLSWDTSDE